MDIKKFAVQDASVLVFKGPEGKPLIGDDGKPMTAMLYGPGSKQYAKAQFANTNRVLEQMKGGGLQSQSVEDKARFLADITKEFSQNIEYDGLQDGELFRAVYADLSIGFIAEQAAKHATDWANFMKASPAG